MQSASEVHCINALDTKEALILHLDMLTGFISVLIKKAALHQPPVADASQVASLSGLHVLARPRKFNFTLRVTEL